MQTDVLYILFKPMFSVQHNGFLQEKINSKIYDTY